MWADQLLKDTWENLDDVAYRVRRGNVHYHNTIEVIASLQIALQALDRLQSSLDALRSDVRSNSHP